MSECGETEHLLRAELERAQQRIAALEVSMAACGQAETALRERDELLLLFVEYAPASIAMFDRHMCYLSVSRRWIDDYGLGGRMILGQSHYDIFPEIPERWKDIHRRCLDGAVERSEEDGFERADGRMQWIRWEVRPWREASGAVGGIVIFTEDITARKEAEILLRESEERFRLLVESAPEIIFVQTRGMFAYVNPAAIQAFGAESGKDLVGTLVQDRFPAEFQPVIRERIRKLNQDRQPQAHMEFPFIRVDGKTGFLEVCGTPFSWKGEPGALVFAQEVSKRRQIQQQLQRAKDEAESASRAKSLFLANMSHELRTPLNGILGMSNLALMEDLPGPAREYLQLGVQAGNNLLAIINDLLDISKIESGQVELNWAHFDLRDLLESSLAPHAAIAREKGLLLTHSVAPGVPERIEGDRSRLGQVISNLAGNAVKFTSQGYVSVTVSLDEESDSHEQYLLFQVADTGVGIPSSKQEDIFEKFTQGDLSATKRFGGTGLGLAIARDLVRLMGGRIWVESEEGRGTLIGFTTLLGLSRGSPAKAIGAPVPPPPRQAPDT